MLLKSGGDTTQNKKKKRIFFKWSSTYVILGNVVRVDHYRGGLNNAPSN